LKARVKIYQKKKKKKKKKKTVQQIQQCRRQFRRTLNIMENQSLAENRPP